MIDFDDDPMEYDDENGNEQLQFQTTALRSITLT